MNKVMLSVLSGVFLLASSNCLADAQISFNMIKGENENAAFPNAISITSVKMGSSATFSSLTMLPSKPSIGEITFTKARGIASAALETSLFKGVPIIRAQLRLTRPGTNNAYLLVTLEDVFVKSWQISVDESGTAMDTFSLAFLKIRTEDVTTNPDGTKTNVPAGWDYTKSVTF